ncbi:B-cadherin-like isoform X2 [Parambassis ranga]|uniref:B-cadherin-like isoform X2 n=1 Tax=Parambassis ranga TaxID=210632 RepID=A0A6P7IBB5_9TELE|nr:B-cadherin-like isoform X2 [Parambassis ranga]
MEIMHLCLLVMTCLGVHGSSSEVLQRNKRNWIIDSFEIDEGNVEKFPYSLGLIKVEKNLTQYKIRGPGVDEEPKGILQINEDTGEITVCKPVDYEEYQSFTLTFLAVNKENNMVIDTQLGIEITIKDANDNPPIFDQITYKVSIKESTQQGTDVITVKATDADSSEAFKNISFSIVSVEPRPEQLEFFLQRSSQNTATISFKGCLDHEKAERYSLKLQARDHGPKPLSGNCTVIIDIEDGNNHLPVIKQQKGPARVKEGEKGVLVTRLQVTDEDTKGTEAWRAKYKIQGDTSNKFKITTDPETNEGLLCVEEPLNFEQGPVLNITITVENDIPYYSCKVEKRTYTGLWEVIIVTGAAGSGTMVGGSSGFIVDATGKQGSSTHQVTVTVVDVNEPPDFKEKNKTAQLLENKKPGQHLATFTATDPDITSANTFKYIKGEDPADWVTVDAETGRVTTSKIIDHESPHVKDSVYVVTVYAVDDGKPPATGTATLSIHITDENDHAPTLAVSTIDMCQSEEPSMANVTVLDLDKEPYGGPFNFKLHGEVEGKWRVDPEQGYTFYLVKEKTVHSGHHELAVEVSDRQGNAAVHNLMVTVCNCPDNVPSMPSCQRQRATGSTLGAGTLMVIFFTLLLFLGMLPLCFFCMCKPERITITFDPVESLMMSNSEIPGNDCMIIPLPLNGSGNGEQTETKTFTATDQQLLTGSENEDFQSIHAPLMELRHHKRHWGSQPRRRYDSSVSMRNAAADGNAAYMSRSASSTIGKRHFSKHWLQQLDTLDEDRHYKLLLEVMTGMLYKLQEPSQELYDYEPHVYAEEGAEDCTYELDAISIPDVSFDPDMDLDVRFSTLASVCMPSDSTAYSTTTSYSSFDWTVTKSNQTTATMEIKSIKF